MNVLIAVESASQRKAAGCIESWNNESQPRTKTSLGRNFGLVGSSLGIGATIAKSKNHCEIVLIGIPLDFYSQLLPVFYVQDFMFLRYLSNSVEFSHLVIILAAQLWVFNLASTCVCHRSMPAKPLQAPVSKLTPWNQQERQWHNLHLDSDCKPVRALVRARLSPVGKLSIGTHLSHMTWVQCSKSSLVNFVYFTNLKDAQQEATEQQTEMKKGTQDSPIGRSGFQHPRHTMPPWLPVLWSPNCMTMLILTHISSSRTQDKCLLSLLSF